MDNVELGGKAIRPPFTIPSGIVTVSPDVIVRVAEEVGIGLVTAKSVGVEPRNGYAEPLFSRYSADSISSAVGLSNPGVDAWVEEMGAVRFPADKFLLVSIFADNTADFVELARRVAPLCDGVEINFCCPHSLKYGAVVAEQEELTAQITRAVRQAIDKVIVVKLTPDGPEIGQWAARLVAAGADAVAAIGPTKAVTVVDEHTGTPVLSYGSGGLSGPAIFGRTIECVREIRRCVDVPIIASGGIRGADDVRELAAAGANIFSIGTSLAGLDTHQLKLYFDKLIDDLENGTDHAAAMTLGDFGLMHTPMTVSRVTKQGDYAILEFDGKLQADPGQFVFAWLPGIGEKPFGVAKTEPFTLGIKRVGRVSTALCDLVPGREVMIRGPFGRAYPVEPKAVIVGGGCGAVPLRLLAERCSSPIVLLGGKGSQDLLFVEDFARFGKVIVTTEDGCAGVRGTVIDTLREMLSSGDWSEATFYNCGPERMMAAAAELERSHVDPSRIYVGVERHTSCGIGLCGKCALDGYRTCIDGPVMRLSELHDNGDFGRLHREACGRRVAF